jgi:TP901 family phage tail tape measure protein
MPSKTAHLIAKLTDQVSGPAKGMAGALKGTASALDALKAKAGRIDAFRQASKSLDDASQRMKVAQQNLRRIKADMEAAGDGGKKFASALRSAEREVQAATNSFRSQGQEVRAMRSALQEAGVPLKQLAAHERDLRTEIDRTTAALKKQEAAARTAGRPGSAGRLNRLTDGIEAERLNRRMLQQGSGGGGQAAGMLAGAGAARFGATALGIGGAAFVVGDQLRKAGGSAISFERSMIEVGKATDASGADLDAYGEKVLKLARDTGKTKEELASMLSQAGFAGRPKEELMDFTEYAAKAMVAWQTGAEDTGQALAEIGNIYGANQKRIEEIGDAINTMADNSASKETDLLEFMRRSGASAKEAGISAEKMLAFGAAMKEVGVRNEVAATGFEALLNVMKLGEEFSKKAGDGLKGLGLDSTKTRRQFNKAPVETILMLLNKIKDVADPLKKAEIMTNLFGKEYQDDIAKMLNALPKLTQYLSLMGDKAKLASGGVRLQFAQNLDKDVSKIDRATQSIDVLYKRLGTPIKVQLGGVAEEINKWVERLETGDTVAQRLLKRLGLDGGEKKPEASEGDPIGRAVTGILTRIDPKFGKSLDEQAEMDRVAERVRKEGERRSLFGRPAELEDQIRRRQAVLDRSKEVAGGRPGIQASMAREQVGKSEAEIARLQSELAKAWDAIGDLRAREKREGGAFGLGGPGGKDAAGIGPGRFGLGMNGTPNLAPRNVPLPPVRPDALKEFGAAAEDAKTKLTELGSTTASPTIGAASLDAFIGKLQTARSGLAALKADAASMPSPNVGGGVRTGRVTQAFGNSPSAGEN